MNTISRRQFVQQTTKAAALMPFLNIASGVTADTSGATQMTIDLTPGAIGVNTRQPLALNALAAKHGFTSVAPNLGALAKMSDAQRGELVAQMKRQGLRWGSAGSPVSIRATEADYRAQLKRLPALASVLQSIGGTRVNTHISPSSRDTTYYQNFKMWTRRLKEIAAILSDHGQRIGLEYVGTHTLLTRGKYPFIHTMAETKDLIAETGATNIGFVLDSWHWWQAEDSADDIRSLKGHEIIAVDLNDAPKGIEKRAQRDNQRELPMATGVIDTKTFLSAIKETGFDGPVRAEPFNKPLNELADNEACALTVTALKKAFATVA